MKRILYILYVLLLVPLFSMEQSLSVSLSSTQNQICNGFNCRYSGPSILINEVMMKPRLYDSSIKGCPPGWDTDIYCEGEWIELYNPHHCEPVDISCYFLGNSAPDYNCQLNDDVYPAGFILPENSIVPPRGFAIVRGEKAPAVPAYLLVANGGNTIEIIVEDSRTYIGGCRFWFPNDGGWFAFYDRDGVPQDAIAWGPIHQGAEVDAYNPGVVGACNYTGPLISYSQIQEERKNVVSSIAAVEGKTFRRIPDGGSWDYNNPGEETYGDCNAVCIQPYTPTCNGTATVSIIGGTPPYQILWDDGSGQATPTAIGLCKGIYCVTVVDANNNTIRDCISVEDIEPNLIASSPSSAYCEGTTIELYANASQGVAPYTYSWQGPEGFTSDKQNPTITDTKERNEGTYYATVYDSNECFKTEQIEIDVLSIPVLDITNKPPFCEGSSLTLSLSNTSEVTNIEWTKPNGEKIRNNVLQITNLAKSDSGTYSVSAESLNGCDPEFDTISIEITETPVVDLGKDRKICEGSITLDAGNLSYSHLWNTGETTSQIIVSEPGIYSVTVENDGCIARDEVLVELIKPELKIIQEGNICKDKQMLLWVRTNADSILWNTGSTADTLYVERLGTYQVTAVLEGCETGKTIEVKCPCDLIFPNAFIPSGLGINATFGPSDADADWVTSYQLYIYDRWGNLVFESTSLADRWNGKIEGKNATVGAYVYIAYFSCQNSPRFFEKHGTVMLLR